MEKGPNWILFQNEGQASMKTLSKTTIYIIGDAGDWEMRVDLGGKLAFSEMVETALRPDTVLLSPSKKKLVNVELTPPWETRSESAHERKNECGRQGWQARNFTMEVGCQGFPSQSC
ncbi:uncharacterized protein [Argopecten irradians]|uniref:uncharacterized protein n=1 Tax=Argopecten irradians TaxID=31199 RepID=UPI003712F690